VLPSLVPDRGTTTGLDRQVRLALLREPRLDNPVRLAEAARGVAGAEGLVRDEVGGQRLVDQRGVGCKRGIDPGYRGQPLVIDCD
jgi:hypothetical protein